MKESYTDLVYRVQRAAGNLFDKHRYSDSYMVITRRPTINSRPKDIELFITLSKKYPDYEKEQFVGVVRIACTCKKDGDDDFEERAKDFIKNLQKHLSSKQTTVEFANENIDLMEYFGFVFDADDGSIGDELIDTNRS